MILRGEHQGFCTLTFYIGKRGGDYMMPKIERKYLLVEDKACKIALEERKDKINAYNNYVQILLTIFEIIISNASKKTIDELPTQYSWLEIDGRKAIVWTLWNRYFGLGDEAIGWAVYLVQDKRLVAANRSGEIIDESTLDYIDDSKDMFCFEDCFGIRCGILELYNAVYDNSKELGINSDIKATWPEKISASDLPEYNQIDGGDEDDD